jgi:hypothetical protein
MEPLASDAPERAPEGPALPPTQEHDERFAPVHPPSYHFESDALVDRLLDELEGTRSPLPLLQFAAAKLWDTRDATHRRLTTLGYERLSGVAGALSAHADATLAALAPRVA